MTSSRTVTNINELRAALDAGVRDIVIGGDIAVGSAMTLAAGVTLHGAPPARGVRAADVELSDQYVDGRATPAGIQSTLRSAAVLEFGPGGVLFVGDTVGAAVHAFQLRPHDLTSQTDVELGNFHNFEGRDLVTDIDRTLAALLGTTDDQITVNDLTVHQPTQQVFLAVERGRSVDAIPVIVKVDHGQIEVLDLASLPHSSSPLPNPPEPLAQLEFGTQRSFAITDITHYGNEIFVSGVSNQRFASTLLRIAYPFTSKPSVSTVEIWHSVHGQFETRAPIIRHVITETAGQPHLYGVYGCTPLVRLPLTALMDGAHVHGDVIGQLGYGANPLDMFTFADPHSGEENLVVTIDTRGASKTATIGLESAPALPTGGPIDFNALGVGQTHTLMPLHSEHTAMLNDRWAVALQRHPDSQYRRNLSSLASPYFFERRDGMSEMNWPDGPDPFDYQGHRQDRDRGDTQ